MAPFWKENQFVQTQKKTAHDLKNQDARIGSKGGFQLKDSIHFKMRPNWFLGICTLDPI
jgi:hypothetical protein